MSGPTISMTGQSDDCHVVKVGDKRGADDYSEKRVIIKAAGVTVTATLKYDRDGWTTTINPPEGAVVEVQERQWPGDGWVPARME